MYPTIEEVERADRAQITRWHSFLPSPRSRGQAAILAKIMERFRAHFHTPDLAATPRLCPIPTESAAALLSQSASGQVL
jgi:hypothetical protein